MALLFIGAAIMMYIESFSKDEVKIEKHANYTLMKEYLESKLKINISYENITEIHLQLSSSNFVIVSTKKKRSWRKEISFQNLLRWKYFSSISLSTIGFGDVVPVTDFGKMFLVVFALIGIPVHMLLITAFGFAVNDFMQFLRLHFCKICRKQHVAPAKDMYNIINMTVLLLLWLVIGALVASDVMGWSFITALYYAFVAFSTIGYGDYTIDSNEIRPFGEFVGWYTTIGLVFAAGVTNAACQYLAHKALHCDKKRNELYMKGIGKAVTGEKLARRTNITVECSGETEKHESKL
eukprot:Seg1698.9 transcript_id=Seg1698.9/GoldUCD/mRNA.D3Y31 product="Potassium channel subfamily K member 9" protein_id=Seg1698.9/GoldUCD/D3Y31